MPRTLPPSDPVWGGLRFVTHDGRDAVSHAFSWTGMLLTRSAPPSAVTPEANSGDARSGERRAAVRLEAVLLDRDGTLVEDVPYNGDPDRVVVLPGARGALERLRAAGLHLAVVSNQSGVGRGLLTMEQVRAVNRRVEELVGPLSFWFLCPHHPDESCACRKPSPGLLFQAAEVLGVSPAACAFIGDIGADVEAALAVGARPVVVPTPRTRREEIEAAPEVATDLHAAVDLLLGNDA